jgi:hypothetical protein
MQSNGPLHQVVEVHKWIENKEEREQQHTSEFQKVNNFWAG